MPWPSRGHASLTNSVCRALLSTAATVLFETQQRRRLRKKGIAPLMHWKHYVASLLEALHWTATIFVAMLAVVFLSWAVAITAPQSHSADVGDEAAQPINLTF